jgi:hypothetical protein
MKILKNKLNDVFYFTNIVIHLFNNNYILMEGLTEYRERQKILFYQKKQEEEKKTRLANIQNKYKDILEFDPIKRSNCRIVNFLKKHFFIKPKNISQLDIDEIPPLFRYRCYVYDIISELETIDEIYQMQLKNINDDDDEIFKDTIKESLLDEKNKMLTHLFASQTTTKYPVLIDLRIYGSDTSTPIYFNDNMYYLDEITRKKISKIYNKVNPSTLIGEKFNQMIEHSKALCATFHADLETTIEK